MTAPYLPPRPRTLEEALRAAFMPPIAADATATPPVRPDFSGVPMATMRATSAPMPRGPRESGNPAADRLNARVDRGLAMLGRAAAPSADTPEGWLREMFNPVAAGRGTREMANATMAQARRAGRTGNVGDAAMAAGLGGLTLANAIPGGPADDATRVVAANVEPFPVAQLSKYREFMRTPSADLLRDIEQNGIREPLLLEYSVADHGLRLTEGNHRLAAAEALGLTDVPVSVVRREGSFPKRSGANAPVALSGPRPAQRLPEQFSPSMLFQPTPEASAIRNALVPQAPDPKMIDVDGVMRPRFNARGQLIHPTEDGIRNFWRWATEDGYGPFSTGDGVPQVVSHSTADKIDVVQPEKTVDNTFWFTTDRGAAERGEVGAAGQGNIMDLYMRHKRPAGWNEYESQYLTQLQDNGFDSVLLPEDGRIDGLTFDGGTRFKSATNNSGAFSRMDPRLTAGILAALGLGNASRQQERP